MLKNMIAILETMANSPSVLSISELSHITGFSRSAVHRCLTTLSDEGVVVLDKTNGGYVATSKLFTLGLRLLGKIDLYDAAMPVLRKIAQETNETASLTIRDNMERICIARVEGTYRIIVRNIQVGQKAPLVVGAAGKIILAQLSDDEIENIIQYNIECCNYPPESKPSLLADVEKIRKQGFAISIEERETGCASISVVIRSVTLTSHASISISTLTSRFGEQEQQKYSQLLIAEAEKLAFNLK